MKKLNKIEKSIVIIGTICILLTIVAGNVQNEMIKVFDIPTWVLCSYTLLCVIFGIMYMVFVLSLVQARNGHTELDLTGEDTLSKM